MHQISITCNEGMLVKILHIFSKCRKGYTYTGQKCWAGMVKFWGFKP